MFFKRADLRPRHALRNTLLYERPHAGQEHRETQMKKAAFTLFVTGMIFSGLASASDCPFHNKSARDQKVKVYTSKATKNVGPSSQGGADGGVNESTKR
jgi:hypothetical protein